MYTLTVSQRSLFMRLFIWVWEPNLEKLDICRLFWGTILFPLAFFQYKPAFKFVPRLALFYGLIAMLSALASRWIGASIWAVLTLLVVFLGYLDVRRGRNARMRRDEKGQRLSALTAHGSANVDWFFDHIIDPLFNRVGDFSESRAGERIGGFFSLALRYVKAAKQHTCLLVRVDGAGST